MRAMARGGIAVNIGAVAGELTIDIHRMMDQQLRWIGSAWFTVGEGQAMVDMVEAGLLGRKSGRGFHDYSEETN